MKHFLALSLALSLSACGSLTAMQKEENTALQEVHKLEIKLQLLEVQKLSLSAQVANKQLQQQENDAKIKQTQLELDNAKKVLADLLN